MTQGSVYNIQRMSTEDGPGVRTTVFLKGCPLRCLWCSNPESQHTAPQLLYFANLCEGCGRCVEACSQQGIRLANGVSSRVGAGQCLHCGECASVCPNKAREMSGRTLRTEEVLDVLRKDTLFYENSGGGITFGGGEPTLAGDFLLEMMRACREELWHVAVDTCGHCPEELFARVLELGDLFLFDLKHMESGRHKALTGQGNVLILRNLRTALGSGRQVRIRMPLVPGMNDSEDNIAAMAEFLAPFGQWDVDVMPCHTFGRNKYVALGLPRPAVRQYAPDELRGVLDRFTRHGLRPVIV